MSSMYVPPALHLPISIETYLDPVDQAWAISTGTVMVNGQVVDASYVIQNGE